MADADYQRLSAACHCGEPVKLWSGRGRRPRYCLKHKEPPPQPAPKETKECPACRGIFVSETPWQVWCTRTCSARVRKGHKPREEVRSFTCAHCGLAFESSNAPAPMYCRKACKKAACMARDPERKTAYANRAKANMAAKQLEMSALCAYFAKSCVRCGNADGQRQDWTLCRGCKRDDALRVARDAAKAWGEAKHKAAAREAACDECGAVFCPLYGVKPGVKRLCSDDCSRSRRRQQVRAAKLKRRAVERGADAEHVNPWRVFARDGWKCKMCGIDTPKRLRGTIEHNAPELDHVHPVSKGGAHTYANTQCLCRSCNQFKLDRTMEQMARLLAA